MRILLAIVLIGAALYRGLPWPAALPLGLLGFALLAHTLYCKRYDAELLRNSLIIGGTSVLLFVAFFEVGARMLFERQYDPTNIMQPHPDMMQILRPGVQSSLRVKDGENSIQLIPVEISEQGLRNAPLPPKADDEFRIFMLGDSFTMGWVEDDETIPHYLQALFDEALPDQRITVINGGMFGTAAWQQLVFLQERGFPLEPDLVIMQIYAENDIAHTIKGLDYIPNVESDWDDEWWRFLKRQQNWQFEFDNWLRRKSMAYQTILNSLGRGTLLADAMDRIRLFPARGYAPKVSLEDMPWWIETNKRDWTAEFEYGWERLQQDILTVVATVEAREEMEILLYCLPSSASAADDIWASSVGMAEDPELYERYKDVRIVADFFRREGLPWAPVHEAILEHPDPKSLYLIFDGHLSPPGNRLVAETLFEQLQRSAPWASAE